MQPTSPTVVTALQTVTKIDATRPLVTYYDDATGERLDLSGATLDNWVSKTANLLVDGLGLGPGDVAAVRLPPHWLTAAVLLGCWSAGLAVDLAGSDGRAVAFGTADSGLSADEVYALSLAPLGLPFRPGPPVGTLDYVIEIRPYGDHFQPRVEPTVAALADGTSHAALVAGRPVVPAPRVLIDADRTPDPLDWLVAPLGSGATIVLCAHLDPARLDARLATERAVRWP